ncbi:hypothetical protein RhiirA4_460998 [Rhizophagus irregularis]|uniref:F-box domain-containing protein n=1 Tax=Rhizophagus irregularis TaxID=588596 RepID=A0A2I1GHS6_9GLOM|nr:hypothetical protein RhiirA4_460998 [Rhizophagus irregularis]
MSKLIDDILLLILTELRFDSASLYSCILVNRTWCCLAIPILWKYFFYSYNPCVHKEESRKKLYNIIFHFLPKDKLSELNINLPSNPISNKLLFNYMDFFTYLSPIWIEDMVQLSIKTDSPSVQEEYVFEFEIYQLIFSKCKNIKYFDWIKNKSLFLFCPNVKEFFSGIRQLKINVEYMIPELLFSLGIINITDLEVINSKDNDDLISLIRMKNNLPLLCEQLSDMISSNAITLKKIILRLTITLISPSFFPSLANLQYLILYNDDDGEFYNSINWQEWELYLRTSFFPNLQYLETSYLPCNIEYLIIERSGGKISEINICHTLESRDYLIENEKLINIISMNCSKIIRLTMDINPNNLNLVGNIFSNCVHLKKIYYTKENNNSMSDTKDVVNSKDYEQYVN